MLFDDLPESWLHMSPRHIITILCDAKKRYPQDEVNSSTGWVTVEHTKLTTWIQLDYNIRVEHNHKPTNYKFEVKIILPKKLMQNAKIKTRIKLEEILDVAGWAFIVHSDSRQFKLENRQYEPKEILFINEMFVSFFRKNHQTYFKAKMPDKFFFSSEMINHRLR